MQVDRQQLDLDVQVDPELEPVDHDQLVAEFLLRHVRRRSEAITSTSSST